MINDFRWCLLFRILILALTYTLLYLLAHLLNLTKGFWWVPLFISGFFVFKIPVPLMTSVTPTFNQEDDKHRDNLDFIRRLGKRYNFSDEEIQQLLDEYESPEHGGPYSLSEETCKNLGKLMEKSRFIDHGLQTNDKSKSSELCLYGTAATIYREIFEPLLKSQDVLLQAIGKVATEVVSWLVVHGDIQSVVSKVDISSSNSDEKYEVLKNISLFDHSFNTCLHAFELGNQGHHFNRPTKSYLAAAAGLFHDIGKHPFFYPRVGGRSQYRSSDHPIYSVDAIYYFIKLANVDASLLMPIIDAVAKHHQSENLWDKSVSGVPPLSWILQQADYAARRDEMASMQKFRNNLEALQQKDDQDYLIIAESGSIEKILVPKPSRPLNLSKAAAVPPPLRDRQVIERFLRDVVGECINRYVGSVSNLDLGTENPSYACFTYGNDLLVRMSLLEEIWEKFAADFGVELREGGEKFPLQAAIKGLLQYLDHLEPGLVQRPLLPQGFAFVRIQVQQGWDRWTKPANYIPLSLPTFLSMTGMDGRKLEQRKLEEDDLVGRDFLGRINGWKKY